VLCGAPSEIGLESTVVDCSEDPPRLLRRGALSAERLRLVVPDLVCESPDAAQSRRSPGLRHRHYAPRARVVLFNEPSEINPNGHAACLGVALPASLQGFAWVQRYESDVEYARYVFEAFRRADREGLSTIYCQRVSTHGIGAALMDRLQRAAASQEPSAAGET
jgi:L-threonylcarbamoyladenylate synthase